MWPFRDFGSRNGTYVNGERITKEHELKTGDKVKVGPLEFEIQLSVSVSGKKKPKVNSVQEAASRSAATVPSRDKELDITQWLADESIDTITSDPARETINSKTISVDAQVFQGSSTTVNNKITDSKASLPAIDPMARTDAANQKTAPNSRAAAADMLKQLLNRRK